MKRAIGWVLYKLFVWLCDEEPYVGRPVSKVSAVHPKTRVEDKENNCGKR